MRRCRRHPRLPHRTAPRARRLSASRRKRPKRRRASRRPRDKTRPAATRYPFRSRCKRTEDRRMNGKTVMACIDAARASLEAHANEIASLDQAIGDGDHIINLLRGMDALAALRAQIEAEAFAPALKLAAAKVLSTVGGSSGPLFFSMLTGIAKASSGDAGDAGAAAFARAFAAGVEAVGQRGKTG